MTSRPAATSAPAPESTRALLVPRSCLLLCHLSGAGEFDFGGRVLRAVFQIVDDLSAALPRRTGCERDADRNEIVAVRDLLQKLVVAAIVVDLDGNSLEHPRLARLDEPRGTVAVGLDLVRKPADVPTCVRICGHGERAPTDFHGLNAAANCCCHSL